MLLWAQLWKFKMPYKAVILNSINVVLCACGEGVHAYVCVCVCVCVCKRSHKEGDEEENLVNHAVAGTEKWSLRGQN
jgi:hypothetical protein